MTPLTLGITATVASGVLNGAFILPMRRVTHWRWENMWLSFGLFGLVLLPISLAITTVPHLFAVYSAVPALSLVVASGLGVSWGIGALLFGLGVSALGMSLGYSIIMGASAICGTLIPAILLSPTIFLTRRGLGLLASLALIAAALVLCAMAGRKRERDTTESPAQYQTLTKTTFRSGLLISILSGVLSACFNVGFAMTTVISITARHFGASESMATFSVWMLIMGAGFIPSLLYCLYRLRRNSSLSLFTRTHQNWWYTFVMGVLWISGVALYGIGASHIGSAGAAIGWPILTSMTVFTANMIGIACGEWKGARRAVSRYLFPGLMLLVGAVILAGMAGAH